MAETDNLVISVNNLPVVHDRTEVQASDGMDSGETTDPPPRDH